MGCIASRSDINDIHSDTFHVVNIDEHGNKNFEARIKVTETNLELHQKGREPLSWPLKSLRRYGCETGVFTFESGRRGPTGPGVYSFRCQRAEQLFNLLQNYVRQPTSDPSVPAPLARTNSFETDQGRSMNLDLATPYDEDRHYVNVSCPSNHVPVATTTQLNVNCPIPPVAPPSLPGVEASLEGHDYVNVTLQSPVHANGGTPMEPDYLGATDFPRLPPKPLNPASLPQGVSTEDVQMIEDDVIEPVSSPANAMQLNYAQLDLNRNEPNHSVSGEESSMTHIETRRKTIESDAFGAALSSCGQEYAVIDFDRTMALNDVAKLQSQRSLEAGIASGVKKIRHN